MRPILLAVALMLSLPACAREATPSLPAAGATEANAVIVEIIDGDTLVAAVGGHDERVRLLGIDTPESVAPNRPDQCFGEEASAYLHQLLPIGSEVHLVRDEEVRDRYGRLLAYVVRAGDQLFVNLELIEKGFAGVLIYEPNDHYASVFRSAEREAARNGVGLWGVCGGPDVPLE